VSDYIINLMIEYGIMLICGMVLRCAGTSHSDLSPHHY